MLFQVLVAQREDKRRRPMDALMVWIGMNIKKRLHGNAKPINNCRGEKMDNFLNGTEIPMGLGMALAQNIGAMNYFASLPEYAKRQIITHTHTINSKEEMQAYVESLLSGALE